MYIIKNAVQNLARYKVRYLMIGVIMLAIILTTSISIIINSTTKSIISTYKGQFGAEVTIALDYEVVRSNPSQPFRNLTAKDLMKYGDSELLLSKEYDSNLFVNANKTSVGEMSEEEKNAYMNEPGRLNNPEPEGIVLPNVNIVATTNKEISKEFTNGARKIIDGSIYKKPNDCMVSDAYAKLNNLKIGDKIKLVGVDSTLNMEEELTISGIYEDNTEDDMSAKMNGAPAMLKRANEILTGFDTVSKFDMLSEYGEIKPTFTLKDPSKLEEYKKELVGKGLDDYYKVSTDEESYNAIVKPVEGLADITIMFVYAVLVLGGIVLAIIFSMAIRERKYEIGVLRAMGMKKISLAFGLISEVFIITFVTLIIGLGVAIVAAQPVADQLLAGQVQSFENSKKEQDQLQQGQQMVIGDEKEEVEPLSEIKVELEAETIIKIIAIAFALGLLSSVISIIYITKYEPMKILSERD